MKVNDKKSVAKLFLQLVVFMHLWGTEMNEEMVEGCVYSTMTLTCNETNAINISSVILGDSPGCPDANCCPRPDHCTARPNNNHVNEVHRHCNGRPTCTVDVIRERIPCEWTFLYGYHNNDFERITYDCINNRKMVEGCVYSTMTLTCNERKVINITSVVLGDSPGCNGANCCPRHNHCTAKPNDNHVDEVHRRCNRRLTCTVAVIREGIPCEWTFLYGYHNNDFERITYVCVNNEKSTPIPRID